MKILRIAPSEMMPKRYTLQLSFDSESNRLTGTVGTILHGEGDLILDIDCDLTQYVGKLVEFRIAMSEKGHEMIHFDALKNYSLANGMPTTTFTRTEVRNRIFRIYVNENIDDSIIQIFHGHEAIEGFEDIVEDGDIELRMYNLVRRDANAKHLLDMVRLKSAMLGVVDQRDSVSYLEAQVDILTRLVLELHKDDNRPLTEILRKADEHSVLNIKDEASLANEFVKKKAWVRTVQKDYYEAKKALEGSAP